MAKLYDRTFGMSAEDTERDHILSVRMEALQFIKPEHLEIAPSLVNDPSIETAQRELQRMIGFKVRRGSGRLQRVDLRGAPRPAPPGELRVARRLGCMRRRVRPPTPRPRLPSQAPRDKLVCILNCCRVVNNLLAAKVKDAAAGARRRPRAGPRLQPCRLQRPAAAAAAPPAQRARPCPAGADDFTPVLIYVTIKARPRSLAANLSFIERYRMQSKLSSESQYYFIQLVRAHRPACLAARPPAPPSAPIPARAQWPPPPRP
jgi:hypothetical protein